MKVPVRKPEPRGPQPFPVPARDMKAAASMLCTQAPPHKTCRWTSNMMRKEMKDMKLDLCDLHQADYCGRYDVGVNGKATAVTLPWIQSLLYSWLAVRPHKLPNFSTLPFSHQENEGNNAVPPGFVRGLNGITDIKRLAPRRLLNTCRLLPPVSLGRGQDVRVIRRNPCNSLRKIKHVNNYSASW